MKKNSIKAFTLTEMLIVIVIIGILIAALLPRMQAAQGRARDVSRKTALSQIQSAIVVYQWDYWKWPGDKSGAMRGIYSGIWVSSITDELNAAWMNDIPKDPLRAHDWSWLEGMTLFNSGDYGYLVTKRNSVSKWWFVLMAKVEVPGSANRVVCKNWTNAGEALGWLISGGTDIGKSFSLCSSITKGDTSGDCTVQSGSCKYWSEDELRYVVIY